uniref:Origin recognition complex subunit 2 n=1 Tax=Peronospora matthiolae TaxID=2874970 RepID=A0AAV1TQ43_9STRA
MSPRGLRARFRHKQSEPSSSVELGASSANAYFTAKRLRQRVPRKAKPAPRIERVAVVTRTLSDGQSHQIDPETGRRKLSPQEELKGHIRALQLPLQDEVIAELRATDELVVGTTLTQCYDQDFLMWKSEVLAGYNLLFYGVGSKLSLLQKFAASYFSDGVVMQVHGYLPVVSLKYVVETIQEKILHIEAKPNQSLVRQCQDIALMKSSSSQHVLQLYLIVHSIDGPALRNPEAQTCLSWLAKAPSIALVASMDHINGPSIWKEEDFDRFEWLSQNLDTCEPYTDEIELRLTKRSKTADATSNGVKYILQSLTPTDVATLEELARQQLAAADPSKKE